jgi:SAM-dependent methyltransferase
MSTDAAQHYASYDDVVYPTYALPQTHPDRLATHARLFRMSPARVERCRVLEVGCGTGLNLAAMALYSPGSLFIGIDIAGNAIDSARKMAADLNLSNVQFLHRGIGELPVDADSFDYIIAHGVYSWVPPDTRDQLLAMCQRYLAPQGVAYVSYNTYPGHHVRRLTREAMLYRTRGIADPAERLRCATEFMAMLAAAQQGTAYGQLFTDELNRLQGRDPNYLLHDQFAQWNEPAYFHQFVEHAGRHGMQYLAEADFRDMFLLQAAPDVQRALESLGGDRVSRQQHLDFFGVRFFRQTLLCREGIELDASLNPNLVGQFLIGASLHCASGAPDYTSAQPERFVAENIGEVRIAWPVAKAALTILGNHYPRALPFDSVLDEAIRTVPPARVGGDRYDAARALSGTILQCYAAGLLELHSYRPALPARSSPHLLTNPLTRWELERGRRKLTTLYHRSRAAADASTERLLLSADGTRDRSALLDVFATAMHQGGEMVLADGSKPQSATQARAALEEVFDGLLAHLVKLGFLLA